MTVKKMTGYEKRSNIYGIKNDQSNDTNVDSMDSKH